MRKNFAFIAMALSLTVVARDFTYNGINYTVISEEQKTVSTKTGTGLVGTGYTKPGSDVSGRLTLPATVSDGTNDYTLTEIGDLSFIETKIAGQLVIPNTVTRIGRGAFADCKSLSGSLLIPNSVDSICDYAFSDCTGLDGTLTLPESLVKIGHVAFSGCSGLTGSLIIPNSVTFLGGYAFNECTGFNGTLKLSESLTEIRGSAFAYCAGFTGELRIPESVVVIDPISFRFCKGFTGSLIIPNSVKSIGSQAFIGCEGLDGELVLPEGLTTLDYGTFFNCNKLKSVRLPKSLKQFIGYITEDGAFESCAGLSGTIVIPDSVEYIGHNTFKDCTGIDDIVVGRSVKTIGQCAFYGMGTVNSVYLPESLESMGDQVFNLTDIKMVSCAAKTPPTVPIYNYPPFTTNTFNEAILTVPEESLELYRKAESWRYFRNMKVSGIAEMTNAGGVTITAYAGGLTISNAAGLAVAIHRVDGSIEASFVAEGDNVNQSLAPGLYIVKAGPTVAKALVK